MRKLEKPPVVKSRELGRINLKWLLDSHLQDIVHHINEDYLYWDKVKYQKAPEGVSQAGLWQAVKLSREFYAKEIGFGNYKFTYNLGDSIQQTLHKFDLNIGGHLGSSHSIPQADKERYLLNSIMEEAIASSQIEGAVTTRKKAKEMLRKNARPRNKSEQMILNNYLTIKHILEIKDQPLTHEKLLEVHRLITRDTLEDPEDEGQYRTDNQVEVIDATDGEIVHTPPAHGELPELMEALFRFFNDEPEAPFIHPIIKGCILHFMVGFIHPFADGNGRTARALFYWYLLRRGYWLTEYLSISRLIVRSKNQYAMAFVYSETDGNDLTYFIRYKLKTMNLAYQSLREYITRKMAEKKQFLQLQQIPGLTERQAEIIRWLAEESDRILTVKEVEITLNVSNQTARTDLEELVEKGFLTVIPADRKTKRYVRSNHFDQLLKR